MVTQHGNMVTQSAGKGQAFFPKVNQEKENLTVDARELHGFLESKQEFAHWIKNRIKQYDFQEGIDFVKFDNFIKNSEGRPSIEYHLTIDMAKELCMVERNAKGREARRYFC